MNQSVTNHRPVSPFQGEPETTLKMADDGTMTFRVTPRELTPERARWARRLTGLSTFGLIVVGLFLLAGSNPESPLAWIVGLVGPFFLMKPLERHFFKKLRKESEVVFTPEEFRVKTKRGHWNVYDRSLTHRFVMQRHDKTRKEQEEHDLQMRRAQQNGRIIRPPRYFAESYHIIFEYMGHRHDVLTVYDKNRATAVTARLKACDEFMNNRARMGDGEVLNPAEQWSDQPGGLPAQA